MVANNPCLEKVANQGKVNNAQGRSKHADQVAKIRAQMAGTEAGANNPLGSEVGQNPVLVEVDAAALARQQQKQANQAADDSPAVCGCSLPDFDKVFHMLNSAGVGFAQEDQQNLKKSLKQLSTKQGLKSLRFWGQIQGVSADYLIAEGSFVGQGVKDESNANHQPRGTGVNTNTFFYAMNFLDAWTQLPDLNSAQYAASLSNTKQLSGNPAAETELLRALIARISGETELCPSGAYADNEEGGVSAAPDFTAAVGELESVEAWQHLKAYVLPIGATAYPDLGEDAGEEAQAAQDAAKEAHPEQAALRGLEEGTFSARMLGDKSTYAFGDGSKQYSAVAVKSNNWPGATSVAADGGLFASVYIGNGIKQGTVIFTPAMPPVMQSNPEAVAEQDDPTQAEEQSDGEAEDGEAAEE